MSENKTTPNSNGEFTGWVVMAISIWITVVGVTALLILPIIVGGLSDNTNFSDSQIGYLASADMAGMGLVSTLSIFWVRKVNWRVAVSLGLIVLIAANILSASVTDFYSMLALRFVAGLGGGLALSIGLACQSDCTLADKAFSYFVALEFFLTSIGFLLLPDLLKEFGLAGLMYVLAGMGLSALLFCGLMPSRGIDKGVVAGGTVGKVPLQGIWVLLGCLFFFTSQGGLWAFIERIGVNSGMDSGEVGNILAISSYSGLVGALGAVWLREKLGLVFTFLLLGAGELLCMLMLLGDIEAGLYLTSLILFQFFWALAIPLMMSTLNQMDRSGRLVLLVLAVAKIGYAIGPALMGQIVNESGFTSVVLSSAAICVFGVIIIAGILRRYEEKNIRFANAVP